MSTWSNLEQSFHAHLEALYPAAEIKKLFLLTVEHVAAIKRLQYNTIKQHTVAEEIQTQIKDIQSRLAKGQPIQHIFHEAPFYGHLFEVNESTLIPRPETEELVHLIIKEHRQSAALQIIDIGTGSGCIPVTLSLSLPQHRYWAVDISKEALSVARRNSQKLGANVQFIEADILEWEFIFPADMKFDVIVSNPPYIRPEEKEQMHPNVLQYEPHLALFVTEAAPLLFYEHIADFALTHLTDEGALYFEINQYLGKQMVDLLRKKGFAQVNLYQDINGADRMVSARRF